MVEPVVEEQPETFEDSLESSDEKPDFDETKNTSISTFMVGAEKAFQSLPPNICEFYRSASFDEIKQHLDEQWKFNLSCECCHERPIHFAVRYCHDLLNIWSSVTEIDLPNKSGETALHVACEMNSLDAVVYLLSRGADPLKKNAKGETCLYVCQRQKYTSLAKTILQTMDIQSIKEFPEDHMVVAAREGSVDFVKLFLKFKANINYLDKDGNSATSLAVQLGHKDILVLLLKNKANIKQTYMTEGNSLLHIACK
uniref:ankyrin repeat domain-containing protein n=1 Tax=Flavobacterium poyangense TaxID=2204302 RepID=UPI001AB0200F